MNVINQHIGDGFAAYNADTVEFTANMPSNSIDFSVYSPPFVNLFTYSDSERDMGNVSGPDEFRIAYGELVRSLLRVTKPGRLTFVHCSDIPTTKGKDGVVGLYDFPSLIREVHEDAGWTYHSRVTVWKDPVVEMQRTKALGLLYKNFRTNATRCRQGMPDYCLVFRKVPTEESECEFVAHDERMFPVTTWQQWASPVWMDINQTDVLNVRVAREDKDERHVCPLQLDLIERAVRLWTNEGEVVYSPFMGIGSEGYASIKAGRRFVGTELKSAYFAQAVKNMQSVEAQPDMLKGSFDE